MASSHSTPITNIPVTANVQIKEETHEDDPEVQAILNEVQVQKMSTGSIPPASRPAMQPSQAMMYMNAPPPVIENKPSWIHTEYGKRAIVAAVVAALLFYPRTFQMVYEKVPSLARFSSYDTVIRTAFLAVVLYLFMLKLNI